MCRPGTSRAPLTWLASTAYRMSLTSVDLPDPERPVTATKLPERERDRQVAQVVLARAVHDQLPAGRARPAHRRRRDRPPPAR